MRSYTFHVSIPGTGRTWRKIELPAHYTLSHLHHAIQSAFRFSNDHLYSFFMSGKAWDSNSDYRLPEGTSPWAIGEVGSAEEVELEAQRHAEARQKQEQLMREEYKHEIQDALGAVNLPEKTFQAMLNLFMENGISRQSGNVLTTRLGSLRLKRKQTFMYLFDYGSEWRFKVRVHAINENADPNADYPRIVESVGTPPRQYGGWD
ncbi:MAG: IS1096 element passenger TnpR family protein [Ardenticatenaceae bacterium]